VSGVKMIVTDLDRTLLRTDKTISAYTARMLADCRTRGMLAAFATARPLRSARAFVEQVTVDCQICHNGALAVMEGQKLFCHGITPSDVNSVMGQLLAMFEKPKLSVEIDDRLYANFAVDTAWNLTGAVRTDFSDLPRLPAEKIVIGLSGVGDAVRIAQMLPAHLYVQVSDGKLGLIMNRAATKWNAIADVAERLGIGVGEIVAFGDDLNDISMLRGCGVGVAVGNALDEVKAVADVVCGGNDDDGVAKWIEENLL